MPNPLKKGLALLLSSIFIISFCYFYVDRSFAFWSHEQNFAQYSIFKRFTQIIEWLQYATTLFYIYFVIQFFYKKVSPFDKNLLVVANSLALTYLFKDQLKFIFGRYWPQTWTHGNPSLLDHNAYGFHFFKGGSWYQAFPSGHAALALAAMTAVWIIFPKLRWLSVIVSTLTVIGLLGMNYHFVSDVISGGVLGVIVGYVTASIMGYKAATDFVGDSTKGLSTLS